MRGRLWGFWWFCCWERDVIERFRGLGDGLEGGGEDIVSCAVASVGVGVGCSRWCCSY